MLSEVRRVQGEPPNPHFSILDHEIQLVPQDYIDSPDFADHKPCLYVVTKNVGFRQRNVDWIDDRLKNGGDQGLPLVKPWHPVAGGRQMPSCF